MRAAASDRPRVTILRGHQANPWELGAWQEPALAEHYEVRYVRSRRGWFDTGSLALESVPVRTVRDLLPTGPVGDLLVRVPGERYLGLGRALEGSRIVHSQELGYWYSMQAAQLKQRLGFRLVLTVWETIPFRDAYRNIRTRAYRARTLAATDLFLAATERARHSLLLEGADPERIRVCPPGIDVQRFAAARRESSGPPLVISPGRLVWEKGHQDVLRALALLRTGELGASERARSARLLVVGRGPEEQRLRSYAAELGLGEAVEFRGTVPYEEMPHLYGRAQCMVLASLPTWCWEEQFGMVLAEAMAARLPLLASTSGAIPEVAGPAASYFAPGDWVGLAGLLSETLAAERSAAAPSAHSYPTSAMAERLADAYAALLDGT